MRTVEELRRWRVEAIPFWTERAWDAQRGGFYESLDLTGRPIEQESRRVRVQARQIYSFAVCSQRKWADTLDLAESGWAFLLDRASHPDGGFVHRLTADGDVASDIRDLYDHAFLLLAVATLWRVTGKPDYEAECARLAEFIGVRMAHPELGFVESLGGSVSPRRQNPHMHLFEALMVYHQAGGERALDQARKLKDMFLKHFFSQESSKLFEFFEDDLRAVCASTGPVAEPGHLAEWVWLLDQFARLDGSSIGPEVRSLFDCVLDQGINPTTGLLYATLSEDGRPVNAESRTWMQTEWVRAAAVGLNRGFDRAELAFEAATQGLLSHHFTDVPSGGWQDRIDAKGAASMDRMPASTLYHVIGALIEADKLLDSDLC
ncbi:MAG: AGE family epimerase/isomerase [Maricaulis sp.]|uniref:AGE family epimerase/isomerase n=1 Tax=Maricaulis sp. TaxID=1486257 RepID=UPI0026159510|nr:AGE family epimerase/isomerase [Maricaulis sp.]MDM7984906.1 AGE family epimerase/isomerase [Maricaulis sp.]